MSSNILEQLRANHELAELYERAVCSQLDEKPSGVRFERCIPSLLLRPYKTTLCSLSNQHCPSLSPCIQCLFAAKSQNMAAT